MVFTKRNENWAWSKVRPYIGQYFVFTARKLYYRPIQGGDQVNKHEFQLSPCKLTETAVFSPKKLLIKACRWYCSTVFSSRIHSNATKLGRPYLDKMTKFCSAARHSPLCNLEVTWCCISSGFLFFWFSPKIVQIQYFLAHCAVNLSFMSLFTCVFSFWILLNPFTFRRNFIENFRSQPKFL